MVNDSEWQVTMVLALVNIDIAQTATKEWGNGRIMFCVLTLPCDKLRENTSIAKPSTWEWLRSEQSPKQHGEQTQAATCQATCFNHVFLSCMANVRTALQKNGSYSEAVQTGVHKLRHALSWKYWNLKFLQGIAVLEWPPSLDRTVKTCDAVFK